MAESNSNGNHNTKSFVQNKLFPIIVIIEIIAIILSFSDSLIKLNTAINENYYLVISVIWGSSILFLYKSTFKKKKLKIALYIIASLTFLAAVSYKYWEINIRKTFPSKNPELNVSLNLISLISTKTFANTSPSANFKIEVFYLNDQLCSFKDAIEFKFAQGPEKYRTFSYNQDVNIAFEKGNCTGLDGNKPLQKVLPLIQKRLDEINRKDLKQYIKTANDLSKIIATRGDIFEQIMFTDEDILKMKATNSVDYSLVKDWLVKCIGIKNPVITFALRNLESKDIIITKVEYEVIEVGQVLGGESGPLYPILTYNHILSHSVGNQERILNPPILLRSNSLGSFNIRLMPDKKQAGLAWLLKIKIYDTEGNFQTTDVFQIIMSK